MILPVVILGRPGKLGGFLGTGFFIEDESFFITAAHNVELSGVQFGVLHVEDSLNALPVSVVYIDKQSDIAVLEVNGYHPLKGFALAHPEELYLNTQISCLEYGTTLTRGDEIRFNPAFRLGNVTRSFSKLEILGRVLTDALEVSFPALRGASGAPVLINSNFRVIGMLVGNMSYHLLPSQIETVTDEAGKIIEETKFMLPLGIAAHANAIRTAVQAILGKK